MPVSSNCICSRLRTSEPLILTVTSTKRWARTGSMRDACSQTSPSGRIPGQLVDSFNSVRLPEYFCKGQLVALSKLLGDDCLELSDERPIVVRVHLSKKLSGPSSIVSRLATDTSFTLARFKQASIEPINALEPGPGSRSPLILGEGSIEAKTHDAN
jgi:hypothetical protein